MILDRQGSCPDTEFCQKWEFLLITSYYWTGFHVLTRRFANKWESLLWWWVHIPHPLKIGPSSGCPRTVIWRVPDEKKIWPEEKTGISTQSSGGCANQKIMTGTKKRYSHDHLEQPEQNKRYSHPPLDNRLPHPWPSPGPNRPRPPSSQPCPGAAAVAGMPPPPAASVTMTPLTFAFTGAPSLGVPTAMASVATTTLLPSLAYVGAIACEGGGGGRTLLYLGAATARKKVDYVCVCVCVCVCLCVCVFVCVCIFFFRS